MFGCVGVWVCGISVVTPIHPHTQTPIQDLVGSEQRYIVRKGDSLLSIARRFYTDPGTLARLNGIKRVLPGASLRIPGLHILPAKTDEGIVLNIPERALYVFDAGRLIGRYPVAVGMKSWPTPTGRYEIREMIQDPIWVTPLEMMKREGAAPAALPPNKRSPLGDRWMGWCRMGSSESEVGFHGTHDVRSIGTLASHACVRLYPEHARRMFDQVYEGMPVLSLYEPVKIGKKDGAYYLSVSPDIYGLGKVTLARVQQLLRNAGICGADPSRLRAILKRQDGYPYAIARDGKSQDAEDAKSDRVIK